MVNRRLWIRGGPKPVRPMFAKLRSAQLQALSLGLDEDVEPRIHDSSQAAEPSSAGVRRLLFVNQYYWPDHASTAQHLTDLAESLAARDFECHVLCAESVRGRRDLRDRLTRCTKECTFTACRPHHWVGKAP